MTLIEEIKANLKGSYLFTKYPEIINGKDLGRNHKFPFAEGGWSDKTIVAETMRFLPVASISDAKFMVPLQAPKEQIENLRNKLNLEVKDSQLIYFDNNNPESYIKILNRTPKKSLHVLHPYDNINHNSYAINPQIILELNNKANLDKLVEYNNIPKRELVPIDILTNGGIELLKKPYVLKKITGSAGDGIKIIHDPTQISENIETFLDGETEIIVEELIDASNSYSVQFFVDKKKNIHYVGHAEQKISPGGEYEGVTCILDKPPDKNLLEITQKACNKVVLKDYYGFVEFDVIQKRDNKQLYIVDPNIRLTAATPVYILKDKLVELLGNNIHLASSQMKADNPSKVIETVNEHEGLLLSMSHKNQSNIYKFFAMFGANNKNQIYSKWTKFKEETEWNQH